MTVFGSVPYLNAKPLLEGLAASQDTLRLHPPSLLHQAVLDAQVSVALLPVASYLENPGLRLIPGTGIVSRGEVRSVKVFHAHSKIHLSNTASIYLDPHSKTSQRLLKLLLVKKYRRSLDEIVWTSSPEEAQSVLTIGDRALAQSHFDNAADLGLEWHELTGLPFVYACWMSQTPLTAEIATQIHNAKMRGKQALPSIAQRQTVVSEEDAYEYLTRHIHYDLEGPELVGLKTFFDWVVELENQRYDTSLRFVA